MATVVVRFFNSFKLMLGRSNNMKLGSGAEEEEPAT